MKIAWKILTRTIILINIYVSRVNERRYEFGDENGAESWVCAKIPHDGAIKKDCVPKVLKLEVLKSSNKWFWQVWKQIGNWLRMPREVHFSVFFQREAPTWYAHLQLNRDYAVGNTFCKKNIFQAPRSSLETIKPTQGCNGFVCFCDDRDGCNSGQRWKSVKRFSKWSLKQECEHFFFQADCESYLDGCMCLFIQTTSVVYFHSYKVLKDNLCGNVVLLSKRFNWDPHNPPVD